jgi:hypothetical protein
LEFDKKKVGSMIHFVFIEKLGLSYTNTFPVKKDLIEQLLLEDILIGKQLTQEGQYLVDLPGSKSITNRVLLVSALG